MHTITFTVDKKMYSFICIKPLAFIEGAKRGPVRMSTIRGPRCQLPHSLHNTPTRLKAHYRSLIYAHALALTSVANGIKRVLQTDRSTASATGCVTEKEREGEKKSIGKKEKKGIVQRAMAAIQNPRSMRTIIPIFQPTPSSPLC